MTAFKSGLKTAIPHSMRRNVLNPRLALWPRTPTRMNPANLNHGEQKGGGQSEQKHPVPEPPEYSRVAVVFPSI
jgi:hypothetical protein